MNVAAATGLFIAAAIFLASCCMVFTRARKQCIYLLAHRADSTFFHSCCFMAYIVDLTIAVCRFFQLSRAANRSTFHPESVDGVLKEFYSEEKRRTTMPSGHSSHKQCFLYMQNFLCEKGSKEHAVKRREIVNYAR
ncbi:hypothetical protein B0H21DRAFT_453522 [Amylocystis lapponica]|nr:hypothetical protein B0H21DRAFT_453522 [Amylocystis lapponica]